LKVKTAHLLLRVAALLMAIVLCLTAAQRCLSLLRVQSRRQIEQDLQDTAQQGINQLETAIELRMKFLESLASHMSGEPYPFYAVDRFDPVVSIYNAKCIGYAQPDGIACLTNGYREDISQQEFFQAALRGEMYVSDVLMTRNGEAVNAHSAPVWSTDGTEITGVMFVIYSTEVFNEMLRVGSFEGRGHSCIILEDGKLVAAFEGELQPANNNIFTGLLRADGANAGAVENIRRGMAGGGRALETISDGTRQYFFDAERVEHKPGREQWYFITIVAADVLSLRVQPIQVSVRNMLFCVVVLFLLCGLVYLWTYRKQRQELFRLAYTDSVTGMDNYSAFREKMLDGGVGGAGYVVAVDLRGFSSINNSCGASKGNELLDALGGILRSQVGPEELAAHVSRDSFVLFLHSPDKNTLIDRLQFIRGEIQALAPRMALPHLIPQFGICEVDSSDHPDESYGNAGTARLRFRDRVDLFYSFFDEEMRILTLENQQMEDDFDQALQDHQFEMWYQPKYSPQTGKLEAAEALVRWRKPDGSLVPPGKFIPLFERNGSIARLDEYVFNAVCAQQRAWSDAGLEVVPVSVNVSRASLFFPDIAERYMSIINRHGVSTNHIELEITESAINNSAEMERLICAFHSCGFRILVDDFGSGYSSLSTLTKNYFDNIKIDKSLVDCIGAPEGNSLLESIVQLAHKFHMTVTAEGVEEASQADFLVVLSCDNIQGYYYSKPLPASEFQTLLAAAAPVGQLS